MITDRAASCSMSIWRVVEAVTCIQLLLLVESSQAARTISAPSRRLRAFRDDTNLPRHGPASESFHLSDGSWLDCIPTENQIAAHHPSLQDLAIPMAPSSETLVKFQQMNDGCAKNSYPGYQVQHPQLFAREHGGCREGFIPVQRSYPQHEQLFRKHQGPPHEADRSAIIPMQRSYPQHEQLFRKHQGPPHEADRYANPSRF